MRRQRPTAQEPSVQLATRVPDELRRRLRLYCVETDTEVRQFVSAAVTEKLAQVKARPRG